MNYNILCINPGSTSTKIALYNGTNLVFNDNIEHTSDELTFNNNELKYRVNIINSTLSKHKVNLLDLSAVVGRGGLIPNIHAGGYIVDNALKQLILSGKLSPHPSNFGALLADEIASPLGITAYIYDAVSSNEFDEIATITGFPEIKRESLCHVLNMKATGRKIAEKHNKKYEELNLIIAHLGGGISIGVHKKGKIIDAIRDDSGPFSPQRSGNIPLMYIIDICYSEKFSKEEMQKKIRGFSGIKAHLGTDDCRIVERMINEGNEKAKLIYEAEAYQIAKGIGEMAPVLNGKIDYIILTGGMAYSKMMTKMIHKRIEFLAPVEISPGENEMEALALGCMRILKGEEKASVWKKK
ncbi:butyrate kinase [Anaerovorax odorimutans]|uniref:butyrate kinase n=1 Tax=Anaerovorax odorimutans TaxID=109327 RepID=UPI0003F82129|nr:butyrate kinase [Anaerovorax odorimutans]